MDQARQGGILGAWAAPKGYPKAVIPEPNSEPRGQTLTCQEPHALHCPSTNAKDASGENWMRGSLICRLPNVRAGVCLFKNSHSATVGGAWEECSEPGDIKELSWSWDSVSSSCSFGAVWSFVARPDSRLWNSGLCFCLYGTRPRDCMNVTKR